MFTCRICEKALNVYAVAEALPDERKWNEIRAPRFMVAPVFDSEQTLSNARKNGVIK